MSALGSYLNVTQAYAPREFVRVLFLDAKLRLIRDEVLGWGDLDTVFVSPRQIVRRALELNASGLVLVHNHPSGDPTPSRADLEATRCVAAAARTVDIRLFEHIIVARGLTTSLRALGYI